MARIDKKCLEKWARLMIECGARSVTVKSITGLPDVHCRQLYKEVRATQRGGPSGQMPSAVNWFTKTAALCFSSALFIKFFEATVKELGSKELAFGHAYYHYWRIIGSPSEKPGITALDPERANHLRKLFADQKDLRGSSMSPLKVCKCKKCMSLFVGLIAKADRICPICDASTVQAPATSAVRRSKLVQAT